MVSLQTSTVRSFILVDGPNVDGVLSQVLGRRPSGTDRPRWDRIRDYLSRHFGFQVRPVFVLNKRFFGDNALPFYRFLKASGYHVVLAQSSEKYADNDDPVDEYILDKLLAIHAAASDEPAASVGIVSHDHIYSTALEKILSSQGRVTIMGFREWLAPQLLALEKRGAEILDLETNMAAFNRPLRPQRPFSPLDLL